MGNDFFTIVNGLGFIEIAVFIAVLLLLAGSISATFIRRNKNKD